MLDAETLRKVAALMRMEGIDEQVIHITAEDAERMAQLMEDAEEGEP